jgi:hypothetical protein
VKPRNDNRSERGGRPNQRGGYRGFVNETPDAKLQEKLKDNFDFNHMQVLSAPSEESKSA